MSFCTTCMDRLHHLDKALPASIRNLEGFRPEVELIVLDYGSRDGLDRWMRTEGRRFIDGGRLRYFELLEPSVAAFDLPHAKNVAHRLATGDVVCNLDADNIATAAYLEALRSALDRPGRVIVHTDFDWSIAGRIALSREDFLDLGGYDEELSRCEDLDLVWRGEALGLTPVVMAPTLVEHIRHPDEERVGPLPERFEGSPAELLAEQVAANKERSRRNVRHGHLRANRGRAWGRAVVRGNLGPVLTVPSAHGERPGEPG